MSASNSDKEAKSKRISGWRAFDLLQRRKEQGGLEPDNDSDAYPSLSGTSASQSLFKKHGPPLENKPFSSVVVASLDFPSLTHLENSNLQTQVPASSSCLGASEAHQKLCYLHPWADNSLIQDVLAGVDNNVAEASSLLEAMLNEDGKNNEVESNGNDFASFDLQGSPLVNEEGMSFMYNPPNDGHKQSQDDASSIKLLSAAKSLPIISEPDWVEDDVYLIHRKDAIRMMRSASRFSKAANDAYLRGDHTAARNFSLKAEQEWIAAEKLNAKAAKEILNVRNCENDVWTLDLHGLHAAEAVEALCERLLTVESLVSPMQNGIQKDSGMLLAPSVNNTSRFEMENFGRQHSTSRQRTTLLQVITGKGNHSRGAAALPSAIRNFLNENGYRFDETRPGIIIIRPKFRQR